ncbi:flavin reductase family protein [Pricia sp. S334]|uniref:Flavin reductase family protein n=1 Tax=Pricia mediterranea TaxID=3076079 RepID=A0ABU3L062_9FLAO|nr:flavin reductase family protein [Pricia sp. S334]MDT7827119.1 flavin reductase family protein [Pricia sp. S334]
MEKTTSIDVNSIGTPELHQILVTAIAPRPIAFASTIDAKGSVNLSPFSFFNVFSANPPILIFSPARRVRNNTIKHTLENVREVKEVVINTVNYPMVEQMSLASTEYDKGVNEFIKSGLTPVDSIKVRPPRVKESPVSFECVIDNIIELGSEGGAGNLIIARVVMVQINGAYLDENHRLDTKKLDAVARLGGNWYTRVTGESLFEIPKPVRTTGIGVDTLPKHVFTTDILSANDIGRLGNAEGIPSEEDLHSFKQTSGISEILTMPAGDAKTLKLHQTAKDYLQAGNSDFALKTLFCDGF